MDVKDLLNSDDRPIAYYKIFSDITGCVKSALLLSQAIYWTPRATLPDGWFWKSMEEWEGETGLSRYELQGARKRLVELGFLEETRKRRRPGANMHYRLNLSAIHAELTKRNSSEESSEE